MVCWVVTAEVEMGKVTLDSPGGIVNEAGTVTTTIELLDNFIVTPDAPAGPLSVMVPVDGSPPVTEEGLTVTDTTARGLMVSEAFRTVPANFAAIEPVVIALTWVV